MLAVVSQNVLVWLSQASVDTVELADLPEPARNVLQRLYVSSTALVGKKALLIDDDIRNIFALTTVLEAHEMKVCAAETGGAALELLATTPDIDVVLTDVMMPEMDGYETIRAIRRKLRHDALPIIAVTAKAMKGDREKCLEAGASDYIAKPVDAEHLLAMLRFWLQR